MEGSLAKEDEPVRWVRYEACSTLVGIETDRGREKSSGIGGDHLPSPPVCTALASGPLLPRSELRANPAGRVWPEPYGYEMNGVDALLGRPSLLWDRPDGAGWRACTFGSANDVGDRRDEGEDGEMTQCALAGGDWLAAPNANMGAKPSLPDNGGIGYPELLM